MSVLSQAFSYVSAFFTPLTATATPVMDSHTTSTGPMKPTESSESYFPTALAVDASRRSSVSSTSTGSQESLPLPPTLNRSHTGQNPLDAMSRQYPKPVQEIDVAKQLTLEPRKHSLHHSLKRAAETDRATIVDDVETRAKKLAAAKAELLALASKA